MTAFDTAAMALSRDPNLSVSAVITVAEGDPLAVRAVLSAPDQFASMGTTGAVFPQVVAMVAVADLPERPAAGQTLTARGIDYEVSHAKLDAEGVCWMVELIQPNVPTAASVSLRAAAT